MVKSKSYSLFRYAPWCFRNVPRGLGLVLRVVPHRLHRLARGESGHRLLPVQDLTQVGSFEPCLYSRKNFWAAFFLVKYNSIMNDFVSRVRQAHIFVLMRSLL